MATSLRFPLAGREIATRFARNSVGLACGLLIALLAGCDAMVMPGPDSKTPVSREDRRAISLSSRGQHQAAADAYLAMAREATDPVEQQRYLILVARERLLAGYPDVSRTILDRLGEPIAPSNLLSWGQVSAATDIATGDPERALATLAKLPPSDDQAIASNILRLRANALFRLGDPIAATRTLIERGVWLNNRDDILANQQLLWESFGAWGGALNMNDIAGVEDPIVAGWLKLGLIAWTQRTSPTAMSAALRNWQTPNAQHPANARLVPDLIDSLPVIGNVARQVAVILPLSGRQSAAARAVRDGILAAHFSSTDFTERPAIRIYDIGLEGTGNTYERAVRDGAEFVIGPLLKNEVQELAAHGVSTPTLTLNFLPEQSPLSVGFYQFSLSPEDEARQVARRAAALGQSRALALAPNSAWGERLMNSFAEELQSYGGKILDYQYYDPTNPDFSNSIQRLLLINESRSRFDRLKANLGVQLDFEPRRRADIDLIFLAANPQTGKLIRPQLRFHYAGSVPTYATSAIYQEESRNNSDLNGIMFPDVPWVIAPHGQTLELRQTLSEYWPGDSKLRSRLYALGFDAYRLIPLITSGGRGQELEGMTGTLYLDDRNRVLRELPWARIQRGKPVLMDRLPGERLSDTERTPTSWQSTSKKAAAQSN